MVKESGPFSAPSYWKWSPGSESAPFSWKTSRDICAPAAGATPMDVHETEMTIGRFVGSVFCVALLKTTGFPF